MSRPARPPHPMRRQVVLKGIGLLAAGLAGGAGPAAAQGRSLVIGYQEQPDWLLFVARDLRLFEKAGLSPTFVKFDAGPPMIEAARNGTIDLASVGAVAFLIGLSQGLDWTMIGINPEGAYGQGLVAHKDSITFASVTNFSGTLTRSQHFAAANARCLKVIGSTGSQV